MWWKNIFKYLTPVSFILRVFTPLLIFRYPIYSTLITFMLDSVDSVFYRQAGISRKKYQPIDKFLDLYWYSISLIYAFKAGLPFLGVLITLYLVRLLGKLFFYKTRNENYLILFPNFYENLFIFVLFTISFPKYSFLLEGKGLMYSLLFLFGTKLIQEFIAHRWDKLYYPFIPEFMKGPE